jgi:glycosyltransferase involved in cell wall biosynthesis
VVKVTYILSLIFKSLEYEWIVRYIDRSKIDLTFILLNPTTCELQEWLNNQGIKTYHVPFYGKKSYPRCLISVYNILKKESPNFVNCNLLDANLIGLSAAYLAGVPNRVYTRHHSTFHHVYFKKGKYYDYYSNFLATQIVAVSSLVRRVLVEMEGVSEEKVRLIPHGFGLPDFESVSIQRIDILKAKFTISEKSPVVGVIARYIEWKGIQYIIPAFAEILKTFPNAILLIANAKQGTYTKQIVSLLSNLPNDSYREIEFESDILAFYKLLDVFVHVPIDDHSEAFGRIYPESLASGVPLVCTISGIAIDIIKDQVNALVVPHKNSKAIASSITKILKCDDLRASLSRHAKETAAQSMSMERQKELLENLYLSPHGQGNL